MMRGIRRFVLTKIKITKKIKKIYSSKFLECFFINLLLKEKKKFMYIHKFQIKV